MEITVNVQYLTVAISVRSDPHRHVTEVVYAT
jgi:hypothetical protein